MHNTQYTYLQYLQKIYNYTEIDNLNRISMDCSQYGFDHG